MSELFTPAKNDVPERKWAPFLIGLVAVLVVIGAIVAFTRNSGQTKQQINPYAAKLQISNAKVSAAENYVGGTVTYLDADITNNGDKTLEGADMNLVFKNTMNEIVQKETLPLHVLTENTMGGYPDLVDMSRSPITPGHTKTVRMTLEHVSADWNQAPPQMQLVDLKLK
jgi:archaellum component FlaF (FlaF/FlaG flagellin family)